MIKELAQYRQLERRLWMTRWQHEDEESAEEDAILDEMEDAWSKLSEDERSRLRLEGPRCWPMESASYSPTRWNARRLTLIGKTSVGCTN